MKKSMLMIAVVFSFTVFFLSGCGAADKEMASGAADREMVLLSFVKESVPNAMMPLVCKISTNWKNLPQRS